LVSLLGLLPQTGLAQARWRAQGIHHYRMTVRFSQGWILNARWTVEVRDEQVIGGNDTVTGAVLNPVQMRVAQRTLPPEQRDQRNHCAARMPDISYDPTLGYPSGVSVYASPCFPGGDWTVLIIAFTPLP
jgi:hypothetical protein